MCAGSLYLPVLTCLCWWWELKCHMQGYLKWVGAVQCVTLVQQDLSELLYSVINCLHTDDRMAVTLIAFYWCISVKLFPKLM